MPWIFFFFLCLLCIVEEILLLLSCWHQQTFLGIFISSTIVYYTITSASVRILRTETPTYSYYPIPYLACLAARLLSSIIFASRTGQDYISESYEKRERLRPETCPNHEQTSAFSKEQRVNIPKMTTLLKRLSIKAKSKDISKDGQHGPIEHFPTAADEDDHDSSATEDYEQKFRKSVEQQNQTQNASSSSVRPSLQQQQQGGTADLGMGMISPGNAGRHPSRYGLPGDETTPVPMPREMYGHGGYYSGVQGRGRE